MENELYTKFKGPKELSCNCHIGLLKDPNTQIDVIIEDLINMIKSQTRSLVSSSPFTKGISTFTDDYISFPGTPIINEGLNAGVFQMAVNGAGYMWEPFVGSFYRKTDQIFSVRKRNNLVSVIPEIREVSTRMQGGFNDVGTHHKFVLDYIEGNIEKPVLVYTHKEKKYSESNEYKTRGKVTGTEEATKKRVIGFIG